MARTGLLVVTNLAKIVNSLTAVKKYVSNTLYIQLYTGAGATVNSNENRKFVNTLKPESRYCKYVADIYSVSLRTCDQLDVIVIVGNLKDNLLWQKTPIPFKPVDVLLFDNGISNDETSKLMDRYKPTNVIEFSNELDEESDGADAHVSKLHENHADAVEGDSVVLGGTFDRLHVGHKMLLTEAVLRAKKRVVVGVTDADMIKTKLLRELILPVETRIRDVRNFLQAIDNTLTYEVVPIEDPFGPTKTDPNLDIIIVSAETFRGGEKVNELRKAANLRELQIHCIDLIELETNEEGKEKKVSSSNRRMDLLGTRLREPTPKPHLPNYPYIIGLIGGIASGKSIISQHFEKLGATVINCDKLAHEIYEPGTECHTKLTAHFGTDILNAADNRINRKKLGSIVFADKQKLNELNQIVWPLLMVEVKNRIENVRREKSHDVVMIEAAVLLQAGWQHEMHEVWSLIVPTERAIRRLINRDNLTEEQAIQRIETQPSNEIMVQESTVVFSTQWSYEFSRQQAEKAWRGLQDYLAKIKTQS
ncbi:bifunctional coenzyme A synthase [Sitodiplosis mosellana]|uniref:bifunctional coenzyme A synthase n=1 Tax=Sitodiplosis mosellana TaxID=263140 RepID=UPI0024452CEC|nr:bifunctional coenzyme A synthase [Sitodiplosis mosellana]